MHCLALKQRQSALVVEVLKLLWTTMSSPTLTSMSWILKMNWCCAGQMGRTWWGPRGHWMEKPPLSDVDEILWWRKMWLVWVFVVAWHHFTIWDQFIAEKHVFCSFFGCFWTPNPLIQLSQIFFVENLICLSYIIYLPIISIQEAYRVSFFFSFFRFIFGSLQQMFSPGKKVTDSNGCKQDMDKCF